MKNVERSAITELVKWKESPDRKPLILKGARQVGKTWLMKDFGTKCYAGNYAYFNFDEQKDLKSIFESNKNPHRIIELLSLICGKKILPQGTLIIFDEVQECSEALNSLKYFKEQAPEYHLIAAGSLLGTFLSGPKTYPVGMVNILEIGPLTFSEFLNAVNPQLFAYYTQIKKGTEILDIFDNQLQELYNYYLIIGGMPECVQSWITYKDPAKIEKIQKELIAIYENDFSKYSGKINSGRILMVFRSIVSQLAKENGKFMYGAVRPGGRARDFEEAIEWLISAGMLNRLYNVSKIEHPLRTYDRLDCFKLYLFDTGLLKCMAGIDNNFILLNSPYQFKGALAENYVLQQLKVNYDTIRYFSAKYGEIDFIVQEGAEIVPIEVKAGKDRNAATFKRYITEHQPKNAVRFSQRGYQQTENFTNVPLYLTDKLPDLLN